MYYPIADKCFIYIYIYIYTLYAILNQLKVVLPRTVIYKLLGNSA